MVEVTEADWLAVERWRREWHNCQGSMTALARSMARHRIAAENAAQQEITALRARIAALEATAIPPKPAQTN